MRTTTTLMLALAMAIAPLGTVAAQQGEEPRYETDVSDTEATITIEQSVEERTATTEIVFDTTEGVLDTTFAYENATSETESRLHVALHQLVEYRDTNDNARYDADDEVASAWRLSQGSENATGESNGTVEWQDLETKDVTADDGTEGTLIQGEARFPNDDPIAGVLEQLGQGENRSVSVDIYVFGQPVTFHGQELGPMEVKVEFGATNFPYVKNGTALALVSEATSPSSLSLTEDETVSQVATSQELEGVDVDLAFAWSNQATVDDETTPVGTTTLEETSEDAGESRWLFALSYERGDEIRHDPTLGASAEPQDDLIGNAQDGIDEVPGLTAWAAILGVVGAAALVRTRRG